MTDEQTSSSVPRPAVADAVLGPAHEPASNRTLAEVEAEHIRNVLANVGGNQDARGAKSSASTARRCGRR